MDARQIGISDLYPAQAVMSDQYHVAIEHTAQGCLGFALQLQGDSRIVRPGPCHVRRRWIAFVARGDPCEQSQLEWPEGDLIVKINPASRANLAVPARWNTLRQGDAIETPSD